MLTEAELAEVDLERCGVAKRTTRLLRGVCEDGESCTEYWLRIMRRTTPEGSGR